LSGGVLRPYQLDGLRWLMVSLVSLMHCLTLFFHQWIFQHIEGLIAGILLNKSNLKLLMEFGYKSFSLAV